MKTINHKLLIVILAALSSVAPIATDTYIPSMSMIASYFDVEINLVELSLTIFLLGFASGQFFGGPISDSIGRKKTSLIGLIGFSLFSYLIVFSSSIYELWILRLMEAFFGGMVVVNANATVRDLFEGKEASRVFTLIGTLSMVAPLVAPAVGSLLIHFFTWKAIFVFLGTYGVFIFVMVFINIKETFTYAKQSFFEAYKNVLTNKKARSLIIVFPIVFSGMFIFISKSAFVYIEYFGVSTDWFPFFFGSDVIFVMIMARLNLKLIKKYETLSIVKFGIFMQLLIAIALVIDLIHPTLLVMFILLTAYVSMLGIIFGNLTALVLENFSKNAATATAVVGVLNFTIGAIVATIVSMFHDESLISVAVGIFTTTTFSYFLIYRVKKN
ncbi:Bcr/CflA family efflux MFS transporter [Sulfurospirillum arcachonense]|uniref:Bcr/CflA family efflux MFS transporter n=1 Tax=Sulfurospirillum arcachonense TaxID=57666 RepID=UPI0009FC318E